MTQEEYQAHAEMCRKNFQRQMNVDPQSEEVMRDRQLMEKSSLAIPNVKEDPDYDRKAQVCITLKTKRSQDPDIVFVYYEIRGKEKDLPFFEKTVLEGIRLRTNPYTRDGQLRISSLEDRQLIYEICSIIPADPTIIIPRDVMVADCKTLVDTGRARPYLFNLEQLQQKPSLDKKEFNEILNKNKNDVKQYLTELDGRCTHDLLHK